MAHLPALYRHSLALLTDLYQLTMAYGYWKSGRAELESVFHLFYRRAPFGGSYAVACGLASALELLDSVRFEATDLRYLGGLEGNDGKPLFAAEFLDYLASLRFRVDVDAVPEGTVVFPHEPLVRVIGPLLQCQLLETPLLTLINFPTLIATKASRICHLAAPGESVLEFGLRRAQGVDGGVTASRAAFVGGCAGTSNVLAGRLFGIPVRGTHAHSWVMSFASEGESFASYAEAMPNNCIFLVDTYDTLRGLDRAIEAAQNLRQRGHEMVGIRLDSGNLTELSVAARAKLDAAGFSSALIVASNDLDEHRIFELREAGARIDVWGVGTRLATAFDEPALGGVYKLAAVRASGQDWSYRLKVSEQAAKTSSPGLLQVRRFVRQGRFVGDILYDPGLGLELEESVATLHDATRAVPIATGDEGEDILQPMVREGARCDEKPPLGAVRERAARQVAALPEGARRLRQSEVYPVGLEPSLARLKRRLVEEVLSGSS